VIAWIEDHVSDALLRWNEHQAVLFKSMLQSGFRPEHFIFVNPASPPASAQPLMNTAKIYSQK
jgi:hypothetical protein